MTPLQRANSLLRATAQLLISLCSPSLCIDPLVSPGLVSYGGRAEHQRQERGHILVAEVTTSMRVLSVLNPALRCFYV